MTNSLAEEFRLKLREGFSLLQGPLIVALRQLVEYDYPPEVVAIAFEVFPNTWSRGFPVRAFFLDESDSEYFIYLDGDAHYPSPIDPGILEITSIITPEYEDDLSKREPDLDTFSVGAEEFIAWFVVYWQLSGGTKFRLHATIADHDGDRELNLRTGQWQQRYTGY